MLSKNRIISLLLICTLLLSLVIGCGKGQGEPSQGHQSSDSEQSDKGEESKEKPKEGGNEKKKLVFSTCVGDLSVKAWEPMFKKFEEENNCEIELIDGFTGWPDYWTKLLTSIAGGTAHDVVTIKETYLSELYYKGAAYDISQFIDNDPEVNPDDFVDVLWDTVTFDGGVYGFPQLGSIILLYYNKDLFEEKGYTEPPKDWMELREYAKNLTDESKGQYGFMFYELGTREPCFAWWLGFYWMAGGEVWKNGIVGQDFNINNQAGLKALNLQIDMIYNDKSTVEPTVQETTLVQNGKVAMWMQGSWNLQEYHKTAPDLNWGVAMLPGDENYAHNALSDSYAIIKDTKEPELAYKLIKTLSNEENDLAKAIGASHLPTRKANFDKPPFSTDPNYELVKKAYFLPETKPKPVCEGYEELGVAMATELQKAWFGQVSAEEALEAADKKAAEILARFNH